MKTFQIFSLLILLLISCNNVKTSNKEETVHVKNPDQKTSPVETVDTTFTFENYETGKLPAGWSQYFTGRGNGTEWKIIEDNGNKVLAQLSEDNPDYHFNEIVYDGFELKNVDLRVRMKGVRGRMDQGGGFVWRFIDKNNYYVVRANPLEDNVVLYKVKNGIRTDLPLVGKGRTYGVNVKALGNGWNNLRLTAFDSLFTVYLNGQQLFQVIDKTFEKPGKTGLWTKADAVSFFDDFKIKTYNIKKK